MDFNFVTSTIEANLYVIWLIAACVLIILEITTSGFAIICFAIGAIFAAIVAACGLSINWQLGTMILFTFLSFLLVRPIALRYLNKKKDEILTNTDALIGQIGNVTETINGYGRVSVGGDDWKAVSNDESIIEKGTKVRVIARESLIITVEKI